jgi:glucoamylase
MTRTTPARTESRRGASSVDVKAMKRVADGLPIPWRLQPDQPRVAPGKPGASPHWAPAAKDGVGMALGPGGYAANRVWFTIGQGALSEVFYPRIDQACIRDLALIVTDGREFFSDERTDCEHEIEHACPGVPLYRLVNTCRAGRYVVEKAIFAHCHREAIVQVVRFSGLGSCRLYVTLSPHLSNRGSDNTAWLGEHRGIPMLFAERACGALALACSAGWLKGSAGYLGVSDGLQDLAQHKQLTWAYERAEDGNVALTAEINLGTCCGAFVLALGFGLDWPTAGHQALATLLDHPAELQVDYARNWQDWQARLVIPKEPGRAERDLGQISTAVLRVHEDAVVPGAMIASLSTPWGEVRGDEQKEPGTGGYHLVWSRDLVQAAGGHLAAGAHAEAVRVLRHLQATQMTDGHWPQNMWITGSTYQPGIQLGETALPILLVDLLVREQALSAEAQSQYWPMVRNAAAYIVRNGPSTQEDRWENERGYTPFTLAAMIASLLVAADMAETHGDSTVAIYLRETADAWNSAIESWLYVVDTELAKRVGVEGYYVRIIPPEVAEDSTPREGHLKLNKREMTRRDRPVPGVSGPDALGGQIPISEIVSPDALALVRFGLRAADDPRIVNTVKVVDFLLKVDTPRGPAWRRYNGDGYGEKADGAPFDPKSRGVGRAWPLLTGERAHYELAAGRSDEAIRLLHAMESLAGDGGMIPEQVWDAADIPERGLFAGRPTGSAMPLVWAHAEYLKLRRSIQTRRIFDQPTQTVGRYLKQKIGSNRVIWRFDHQRRFISPGEILRIEVTSPAVIRWTADGWRTSAESRTRDTGLGLYVADLETQHMKMAEAIEWTFFWPAVDRWEGTNYVVIRL